MSHNTSPQPDPSQPRALPKDVVPSEPRLFGTTAIPALLNQAINHTSYRPPKPIVRITENKLYIEQGKAFLRNYFLIPLFIGACIVLVSILIDQYEDWKGQERGLKREITRLENKHGMDFFQRKPGSKPNNIDQLIEMPPLYPGGKYSGLDKPYYVFKNPDDYDPVNTQLTPKRSIYQEESFVYKIPDEDDMLLYESILDGKMSLSSYYFYNYKHSDLIRGYLIRSMVVMAVVVLVTLLLLYFIITFKRPAPLVFDRQRKLVYTWQYGKTLAQTYDKALYRYTGRFIAFGLAYLQCNKKTESTTLVPAQLPYFPSGHPYGSTRLSCLRLLHTIVHFMEYGRDAVLLDNLKGQDWQSHKRFYLFEDKQPKDFDEKIEAILAEAQRYEKEGIAFHPLIDALNDTNSTVT